MSAVESRLAATLAKHHLQDGLDCYRCTCGATVARGGRERHLAAVIASSDDLAVVCSTARLVYASEELAR